MSNKNVLAFDLGASSGRGIVAGFDGKKIELNEIHRFVHNFSVMRGRAYWDLPYLYESIKEGLLKSPDIESFGFDTWGVDMALLDKAGNIVGLPLSYRDSALTADNMNKTLALLGDGDIEKGEKKIFDSTFIASLDYNTIYKLRYLLENFKYQVDAADTMLFLPNLLEYLFSGVKHTEYTIASTSQMYNMKEKDWAYDILRELSIPERLLTKVDGSETVLGDISPDIADYTRKAGAKVISVSGHDTACAVAAVPAKEESFTFLSSGTWSLMGISSKTLLSGDNVIKSKISNEGTYDGGYRPTVNITGLWIIQELRRNFKNEGKDYSFAQMAAMAGEAGVSESYINPDDFDAPGNYIVSIREYLKNTNQKVPETDAELISVVLTSLALKYKDVYMSFKEFITWEEKLYIIGGGVNNKLLCQYTANALNIPVILGPSEATAVGNVMEQFEALGEYSTREEKSEILSASFESETYEPRDTAVWEEAYEKYKKIMGD
ncbi:MAG: hypothetical protein K6D02_05995 [Lachnospiraceae bacterium]|nr:hypothetical protein [Lachnospiraceae bacterium]